MLTLGASYKAHLEGDVTQLALLWRITRKDSLVFRFTDHDTNLFIAGDGTYICAGYNVTGTRSSTGLATDNMEVTSVFDDASITEDDLNNGLWDEATVEVMECIWSDLSKGTRVLVKGELGEVTFDEMSYKAELLGVTTKLTNNLGRIFSPGCDALLGDTRCGKDLTAFTFPVTITSVTDRDTFTDSALVQTTGYFDYGLITWTTGLNIGTSHEIKTYTTGGAIVLFLPTLYDVAVGDEANIIAGCDKSFTTCNSKFGNADRFRGFPHMPGVDSIISVKT
jgi:uncharacterized phage protein (TIGR02218 family)